MADSSISAMLVAEGACPVTPTTIEEAAVHPTVTLASTKTQVAGPFYISVDFSDPVHDLTAGDFNVTNGTASNLDGSGSSYDVQITPDAAGTVTIVLPAGAALNDADEGTSKESNTLNVTYDPPPTVTLSTSATSPHSGTIKVTATFSEDVTGFTIGDVMVVNGSKSNFHATSGSVYTFDVGPGADGAVSIDIPANVAEDAGGNQNLAASQLTVTADNTKPVVTITGPSVAVVEEFGIHISFSEDVTGFEASDIQVANGTIIPSSFNGSGGKYSVAIDPVLGQVVTVSVAADVANDEAGNGNAVSNTYEVQAASVEYEFEKAKEEIKQIIVNKTKTSLQLSIEANNHLLDDAKSRFISSKQGGEGSSASGYVPFTLSMAPTGSDDYLGANGSFLQQSTMGEWGRRIVFGDFNVQIDEGGTVTGSFSGKVAWENDISDRFMLGYFLGADLGTSDISESFKGTINSYGASTGAYFVAALQNNLFADGFISAGYDWTDLDLNNGVLDLSGDYSAPSITLGGSLSGIIDRGWYEVRPELSFSYGWSDIGSVRFLGKAYGLVNPDLYLNAGEVSVANMKLSPEFVVPLKNDLGSGHDLFFSLAPELICESVQSSSSAADDYCGGGAEVGLTGKSANGMSLVSGKVGMDYLNDKARTRLELRLRRQF
ncbi:MAG: hypothetical protein KDJ62_03965 [Rhodobiaceae bacterium]|nr:hypothetical protein [Rhodobiaceae bacterium]MCC0049889.1 hypothetical protein [Rhodobiaceae bacterium]